MLGFPWLQPASEQQQMLLLMVKKVDCLQPGQQAGGREQGYWLKSPQMTALPLPGTTLI
jgi:hypothetical protein